MPEQWDYKVMTYKLQWNGFKYDQIEKDLNDLGQQGWEMTSAIAPSYGSGQTIDIAVIVKKPS